MQKLVDLRDAWVNLARPAVSKKVKALLEQVSSGLAVPDTALDLTALQDVIDRCTPDDVSAPSTSSASPSVPMMLLSKAKIEPNNSRTRSSGRAMPCY